MIETIALPLEFSRFGLIGSIVGALFLQIGWFIRATTKKDKSHQDFIQQILKEDREERQEDRREHRQTTNRLSDAITDLTIELRGKHER